MLPMPDSLTCVSPPPLPCALAAPYTSVFQCVRATLAQNGARGPFQVSAAGWGSKTAGNLACSPSSCSHHTS